MKENTLLTYPAIFTCENGQYWVEFIDLDGCYSDGKTLAEAMENAKEAMGLYLEDLEEYPKCTDDIKNISLWYCGPASFGAALKRNAASCGISKKDIHYDSFDMR